MLLVIPAIEIKNGKCVRQVQDVDGCKYSDDPIEMAKMWRKENAKTLHITDLDGVSAGFPVNIKTIKQMVKTVDIPIELGGGLRTFDAVKNALENGIYRTVIGTMLIENPEEAKRCIDRFGPSKVVLGIDAKNYCATIKGGEDSGLTPISIALNARELGFRRIVYTDVLAINNLRKPNFDALKLLAQKIELRITSSGGVSCLEDLLKLQEYEPLGIDSVIIGTALYENKFPCQRLWRMCEAGNYPYTARI